MRSARRHGQAKHTVHAAPQKIRPGDVESKMSRENFPLLSQKRHTERHPSRFLAISLVILAGGICFAGGPLYMFAKDFNIPEMLRQQDLTGIYLLSAYLVFLAAVGVIRHQKRRSRAWMEQE